jgi:small-conductance mechanosensitive channel
MTEPFKKGDRVEWNSSGKKIAGKVEKKLTEQTEIKGHHVAASEENPQYLVKSDKTGKEAAHKAESLKKLED